MISSRPSSNSALAARLLGSDVLAPEDAMLLDASPLGFTSRLRQAMPIRREHGFHHGIPSRGAVRGALRAQAWRSLDGAGSVEPVGTTSVSALGIAADTACGDACPSDRAEHDASFSLSNSSSALRTQSEVNSRSSGAKSASNALHQSEHFLSQSSSSSSFPSPSRTEMQRVASSKASFSRALGAPVASCASQTVACSTSSAPSGFLTSSQPVSANELQFKQQYDNTLAHVTRELVQEARATSEARRSEAEAWRTGMLEMQRDKLDRWGGTGALHTPTPQTYTPMVEHVLQQEQEAAGLRADLAGALSSLRRARDDRSHLASKLKSMRWALAAANTETESMKVKLEATELEKQQGIAQANELRARLDKIALQTQSSVIAMAKLQADRQSRPVSRSASRSALSPLLGTSLASPSALTTSSIQSPLAKADQERVVLGDCHGSIGVSVRCRKEFESGAGSHVGLHNYDRDISPSPIRGQVVSTSPQAVAWGSSVSRATASLSPFSRSSRSCSSSIERCGLDEADSTFRPDGWDFDAGSPSMLGFKPGVLSQSDSMRGRARQRPNYVGALMSGVRLQRPAKGSALESGEHQLGSETLTAACGARAEQEFSSEVEASSEISAELYVGVLSEPRRPRRSGSALTPDSSTDSLCSTTLTTPTPSIGTGDIFSTIGTVLPHRAAGGGRSARQKSSADLR